MNKIEIYQAIEKLVENESPQDVLFALDFIRQTVQSKAYEVEAAKQSYGLIGGQEHRALMLIKQAIREEMAPKQPEPADD